MNERDHGLAYEYHTRLINVTRVEQQLKADRPKWSDHLRLYLGNTLINYGQKIKDSSAIAHPVDLTQECA